MLCDICHTKNATVHLTEIVNEKVIELHICPQCSQEKAEQIQNQLNVPGLLTAFLKDQQADQALLGLTCPSCKLTYAQFKACGRLGCAHCYQTFEKPLNDLLKRLHGNNTHAGKIPLNLIKDLETQVQIKELTERLSQAVQREEYEQAAQLRDQIKKLQ